MNRQDEMADRQTTAERLAETIRVALDLGLQAWRTTDSRERFIEAQDALSRLVGEHDTPWRPGSTIELDDPLPAAGGAEGDTDAA